MFRKSEAYGELEIDHRESPGFSDETAWGLGLGGLEVGKGRRARIKTKMCPHCTAQVILNPNRSRPRFECRKCDSVICDNCAVDMKLTGCCRPFSKLMEDWSNGKEVKIRTKA
jgi:hypothetical protein